MSTETLAGTRIRTDLKDIGSAISVYNKQFMRDIGATNNEDLLVYATSMEVGGSAGNFQGNGNSGSVPDESQNLYRPNANTRVRGLASADNCRGFMLTDVSWDSYNTSRIDIQRGANAILFGNGSPAGIINGTVDEAQIGGNSGNIEARVGSYGSLRGSFNVNYTLIEDELAIRAAGLYDDKHYRQDPAFNEDKREYVAIRYDPKWMRFQGARTSIKANYEHGEIDANRPRTMTPLDCITPWFTSEADGGLGKSVYDSTVTMYNNSALIAANASNPSFGARTSGSVNFEPWISTMGNGIMAYVGEDGSVSYMASTVTVPKGIGSNGAIDKNINGQVLSNVSIISNYADYATQAGLPLKDLGVYVAKGLTDASIYDFYNKLLDGDTKREWSEFDAARFSVEQTFFNDKAGFEFVVDHQDYQDGHTEVLNASAAITVDINSVLPDGSVNPNVGRPCVVSNSQSNYESHRDRNTIRTTGYFELNSSDYFDSSSLLARIIGRHRFTGMYQVYEFNQEARSWVRYATDGVLGYLSADVLAVNNAGRYLTNVYYLGDSLMGANSASGANISNLSSAQVKAIGTAGTVRLYDSTWNSTVDPSTVWTNNLTAVNTASTESENPANYVGWTSKQMQILNADAGDLNSLYTGANKQQTKTESWVAVWQDYLLDECLVPTVGYRWDHDEESSGSYATYGDAGGSAKGTVDWSTYNKSQPLATDWEGLTWSIVAHVPGRWTNFLPGKPEIGFFYGRSKNFQPGSRVDIYGSALQPPTGKTEEYGLMVSMLDDRVSLRVGHYETKLTNSSLNGFSNSWYLTNMWNWESDAARNVYETYLGGGGTWTYTPKTAAQNGGVAQTQEQADAEALAAMNAFYNNLPVQGIATNYSFSLQDLKDHKTVTATSPSNLAITGDTESEGWETELMVRLTDSWNLSLNVIKTDASRVNMAGSISDFIEERWDLLNGPLGDLRIFSGTYGTTSTAKAWYARKVWNAYCLYKLTEGTSVAELRPWRFNIVTSYDFKEGWMKGINIGAAYRWQDKQVIGYAATLNADGTGNYDIDHPFKGPTEDSIDSWIGYTKDLNDQVNWRIQLNVRNLFASRDLIPISTEPDGTTATWRIPEARTWEITNTFTF